MWRSFGCTLGKLATQQTSDITTKPVVFKIVCFLTYDITHPPAKIRYHASGMVLHVDSDTSYIPVRNARSRIGGLFFLSNESIDPTKP